MRNRMIKPEFWTDERTGRLSDSAKLVFIAMWNISDDEGKLSGDLSYLLSFIYPYGGCSKIKMRNSLDELKVNSLVIPYSIKKFNYILIPNFNKHQRIDKPQESKIPDPFWNSFPIKEYFFNYQNGICPDCNRDMVLVSKGNSVPDPYEPDKNGSTEEYVNGTNSRVFSIDHIQPKSKGGSHNILNLRGLCITCNKIKHNGIPGEFQEYSENVPEKDLPKLSKEKLSKEKEERESTHPLSLFIKKNLLSVTKLEKQLTDADCNKLYSEFDSKLLEDVLQDMDNYKPLLKKYKSVNLTLRKWIKIRSDRNEKNSTDRRQYRKGDLDIGKFQRELNTEKPNSTIIKK